ncbi:MAG: methyltransferase domain-containing protein, partial [Myxococcota bacterium]
HVRGLDFARRRLPEAQFFQMDARQLPFRAAFDVVGAFDVLEHIDEDETVLGQLFEAVRPGGGLMLTVPQHRWLWSAVDDLSGHKRRYAPGELSTKVKRAGFEVVLDTSFVSVLLPLMWATRKTSRATSIDDVMAQFDVHPLVNAAMYIALRAEQVLIRAPGVRLPWGASSLVIARRPDVDALPRERAQS